MTVLVCQCSCPDRDVADAIARVLVAERLAACVQVLPGLRSVYRWQGKVEQADEVLLLIKTTQARLEALTQRVAELHPYELPELVAMECRGGLRGYLDWVESETA